MLYAGISWTATGFEVQVAGPDGRIDRPAVRFTANRPKEIASYLKGIGSAVTVVVDSTNGMLDGGLMAAGLRVHRADPQVLPAPPGFGSVSAAELALTAWRAPAAVVPLAIETGSLTGRLDEVAAGIAASEEATARMTAAGNCVVHGDRARPEIALTFDDGPNPPYTGKILDLLERYGVRATFFCVGLNASASGEDLQRMIEQGHEVGNHTWSHPFLPDLSETQLADQIDRTAEAIGSATGAEPGYFRPPYGSRTPAIVQSLAGRGTKVALWDVDTEDWAMRGPEVVTKTVAHQTRPGSVVLMHDGGGDRSQTVAALPAVIEGLLSRGLEFVRVQDLSAPSFPTEAR
ncbi:polysaccharide deacetylase family protein [Amycolatopsis benzoatilytica]|uniref:polysaccharide deacetylase family protein n=1 Tax=Amycolatopsis benzoatilytica TaxID=346045 RepID=UPI000379241F|nr:polysaccharide deacetylase family protein [Amycolatopsis benzoatilytica]